MTTSEKIRYYKSPARIKCALHTNTYEALLPKSKTFELIIDSESHQAFMSNFSLQEKQGVETQVY